MNLFRHLGCAGLILGGVVSEGLDYVMEFRNPEDEQQLSACPGCGRNLDQAYAFGELQDEGSAP